MGSEQSGRVAPHERCEVRLVLAGTKPLATIEKRKDPQGYAIAVALIGAGMLCGAARPTEDSPEGEVVIVKPGKSALLTEYLHLLQHGVKLYGIKQYHRLMGRLFGYTDADIEAFINAEIHCDCAKCTGNTGGHG